MTIKISWQQLKGLLLLKGIFAVLLATPNVASAIQIKDTSYPIPASAYFVAPDGNATNSGKSPGSPWSVAKALGSAPSGATIVFRGGEYRNVTGKITKKLTLQAYPHEKPWLKGSIVVQGWVADGGVWRKDGWNISFPLLKEEFIDPSVPLARHSDMVYINGVSLKQVGSRSNVGPGEFYVDNANNRLYIGTNPTGKTVEATALKSAITMSRNSANTVVRGLGFAHYADMAMLVGAARVRLENNTFAWNGASGVDLKGADAVVSGNTFTYNGQVGIKGSADRVLLEGNTMSFNNVEHFKTNYGAGGVKFIRTTGAIVRNNLVEGNYSPGIWCDVSCLNITIANNTVRNNHSAGILYELSHKGSLSGNTVANNGSGIILGDSSSTRVSNNTIINSRNHVIYVKDSPRVNTNRAEIALGITWISRNNSLTNNTLR